MEYRIEVCLELKNRVSIDPNFKIKSIITGEESGYMDMTPKTKSNRHNGRPRIHRVQKNVVMSGQTLKQCPRCSTILSVVKSRFYSIRLNSNAHRQWPVWDDDFNCILNYWKRSLVYFDITILPITSKVFLLVRLRYKHDA